MLLGCPTGVTNPSEGGTAKDAVADGADLRATVGLPFVRACLPCEGTDGMTRGVDNVGGGGAKVGRLDIGGGVIRDFCGTFTKGGARGLAPFFGAGFLTKRDETVGRCGGATRVGSGDRTTLEPIFEPGA